MKIALSALTRRPGRNRSGAVLTEACIGISLMSLSWILMTFSFYMANNHIRTLMASRYAAWFAGANLKDGADSTTDVTPAKIDQLFFFQSGLTKVESVPEETIGSLLSGNAGNVAADAGPFKRKVSFGVADLSGNVPFPFDMLRTHLPFMPESGFTNTMVSSSCQWDGIGATWETAGSAFEGVLNQLTGIFGGHLGL